MPYANSSLRSSSSLHGTRSVSLRTSGLFGRWAVLDEAGSPIRFSRVLEQVKGVSQKSLTKTLWLLEQDGLVEAGTTSFVSFERNRVSAIWFALSGASCAARQAVEAAGKGGWRERRPAIKEAFSLSSSSLEQVYVASGWQAEHAAVLTVEL